MEKLKTLKEIRFKSPYNKTETSLMNQVIKAELKQEVIKWLKRYRKIRSKSSLNGDVKLNPKFGDGMLIMQMNPKVEVWMTYFFNITLEDLK